MDAEIRAAVLEGISLEVFPDKILTANEWDKLKEDIMLEDSIVNERTTLSEDITMYAMAAEPRRRTTSRYHMYWVGNTIRYIRSRWQGIRLGLIVCGIALGLVSSGYYGAVLWSAGY